MGLEKRQKTDRIYDGSKLIVDGNGVKTATAKKAFDNIRKNIKSEPNIIMVSPTPSVTQTPTPSITPTNTPTISNTATNTPTPSITATQTNTPTVTPTPSITNTQTPTQTNTQTPTNTITPTPTNTITPTPTQTNTQTPTASITPSPTQTPNCICYGFTNNTKGTLPLYVIDCNGILRTSFVPVGFTKEGCVLNSQYTATSLTISTNGPCVAGSCSYTPTPTPTITTTPTNTPTNTLTPTQTPTNTATMTLTPTSTITPTPTPTQNCQCYYIDNPSASPNGANYIDCSGNTIIDYPIPALSQVYLCSSTTPIFTVDVDGKITATPINLCNEGCPSEPIPPFFRIQNIEGTNPTIVRLNTITGSTFDIDWGDLSTSAVTISSATYTTFTYPHTYASSVYTATFDDFMDGAVISTGKIKEISIHSISNIVENEYTFSAFTATTTLTISSSTLTDFSSSLPNSLVNLYFYTVNSPGANSFIFNPSTDLATLPSFSNLIIRNSDISAFTYDFQSSTSLNELQLYADTLLTTCNFTAPIGTSFTKLWVQGCSLLKNISMPFGFTFSLGLIDLVVPQNSLSAWTYNLPPSTETAYLNQNTLSAFTIDLSSNTNLEILHLYNNSLSAFTNTVSGCTSLTQLRLESNRLTTLPPIFPNNVRYINFSQNRVTGYTSNFPSSLTDFIGFGQTTGQQVINSFDVEVSGATNLDTFDLSRVSLTAWTKTFSSSALTLNLAYNNLTSFDFSLCSGATDVTLTENPLSSGLTNLSGLTVIDTLNVNNTSIPSDSALIQGDFPSSLVALYCQDVNTITSWDISFSGASTNLKYIYFRFTPLNQASTNFILNDLANNNTAINGILRLDGAGGPASPTGGVLNPDYITLTSAPRNWLVFIN